MGPRPLKELLAPASPEPPESDELQAVTTVAAATSPAAHRRVLVVLFFTVHLLVVRNRARGWPAGWLLDMAQDAAVTAEHEENQQVTALRTDLVAAASIISGQRLHRRSGSMGKSMS
jgi:hypothetical protein